MKTPNHLQVVLRDISSISPYANNPRINDQAVEAVAASIREFGWKQPIVIDKDGVIVAGHTRLRAAKLLGETQVPCVVADDLTPKQIKAYRLADNKTGELAEWDMPLLEAELDELLGMDMDFDISQFGFDLDEPDDVPDFQPAQQEEQPRLDQKAPITCPHCGQSFTP